MNREILFRGRRLDNGEWVYGSFVKIPLVSGRIAYCICPIEKVGRENKNVPHMGILYTLNEDIFVVDPATVGEYTGLIDKDGNKIFEGDIIQFYKTSAYVIFRDGEFCAIDCDNTRYCIVQSVVRLTGNIHDNEELLDK